MVDYHPYLGISARSFNTFTEKERSFIEYFTKVNMNEISPVMDKLYITAGPKGYGTSLILARVIKLKERISSDIELAARSSICCQMFGELYRGVSDVFYLS